MASAIKRKLSARARGDFQTPVELARQVWSAVDASRINLIIEPTFGLGSFLKTIPEACKGAVVGWEIDEGYYDITRTKLRLRGGAVTLIHGDVFTSEPEDLAVTPESTVMVIGNPPWVTNSEQGSLKEGNTGNKFNLKSLPGLAALTGKSNFDISEAIILRLISHLKGRCRHAQFAMLGKFTVLRNLMLFLAQDSDIGDFEYHRIDSASYFGAAVDSGLIKFTLGAHSSRAGLSCPIYQGIQGPKVGEISCIEGQLIHDAEAYNKTSFMESRGLNHYVWRQGIKHDLGKVMELKEEGGQLRNGLGESVDVEDEVLYQLYKSSDLYHGRTSRYVIPIYQRDLKDTLENLPRQYPKLYAYLSKHRRLFDARKSSIYRNRPRFTLFGIGDYTHASYKVAIAGLYTEPIFRLLRPAPRPVALDDTCYMIPTNDEDEAIYLLAILNLDSTKDFLKAISSSTGKRRFSKDVLARALIPPFSECPKEIRTNLFMGWSDASAFTTGMKSQLQKWLSGYRVTHNRKPGLESDTRGCLSFDARVLRGQTGREKPHP